MAALNQQEKKLKALVNEVGVEDVQKFRGMGGSEAILSDSKENLRKVDKKMVRSMNRSLEELEGTVEQRKEKYAELEKFLDDQKMLLASTPSIWPTKGWLSSRFGYRTSPFADKKEFHRGIDISARRGSPVLSPANGLVIFNGWKRGYGRVIVLKHARGFKTQYAHLQKSLVKKVPTKKRRQVPFLYMGMLFGWAKEMHILPFQSQEKVFLCSICWSVVYQEPQDVENYHF